LGETFFEASDLAMVTASLVRRDLSEERWKRSWLRRPTVWCYVYSCWAFGLESSIVSFWTSLLPACGSPRYPGITERVRCEWWRKR